MPENKKFWYIQLNVNFFEDERIDWLSEQRNGYAYIVLYLKLCLKTANNNGILTRQVGDMIIPYNVDKIAEITHIDVDIVRVALELYKKIGLIYEADENCNFMRLPEVPKMVGYTTQAALDKRKQRERKQLKSGHCKDNVQDNVQQELRDKSLELIVKSTEKEKDSSTATVPQQRQRIPYDDVVNLYSSICVSYPKLNSLSDKRKKAIAARFRSGRTLADFEQVFRKAEASSFLKGANKNNWTADFDWMIQDGNMTKILEDKYINRTGAVFDNTVGGGFSFYELACQLDAMEGKK